MFLLAAFPLLIYCFNGICGEDEFEGNILRRHRRDTNSTGSGAFFDDPNNAAMYLVLPIMVLVYGGCACIYCCHRCREYIEEKQPLTVIKLKMQGKSFEEIKKIREREKQKETTEPIPQDIFPESEERPHSVKSVPEPIRSCDYLNVSDGQRSVLSSPGIGYRGRPVTSPAKNESIALTKADDKSHPFTIQSEDDMRISSQISSVDTDRRDSGIQDDRDGDIDRQYASTLSRGHSSRSFGSVSLRSELLTAAYTHKKEEDGGSMYPNWSELNEVSIHNTPPPAAQYETESYSAPENGSSSITAKALPPEINNPSVTAKETGNNAVNAKTLPSETSNMLVFEENKTSEPLVYPDIIRSTEQSNSSLRRQSSDHRVLNQSTKNKIQAVNNFKNRRNSKRRENSSISKDKNDLFSSTPKDKNDLFSDISEVDGNSYQNKNKLRSDKDSQRRIDYLDETPQINGRFRMYYQNRRLRQNVENGNLSSVPTVSGSIKEAKINPIHISMTSDGDVKITEPKKRPRVTNVRQLYYPYWN